MSRRKSRIIAFQALYSWDVSKESIDDILTFSWLQKDSEIKEGVEHDFSDSEKEEQTFASFIITGTIDHVNEIDELIKKHLTSTWSMERINKVSLAILRTSIYEMLYQQGSEAKIVIDEAVIKDLIAARYEKITDLENEERNIRLLKQTMEEYIRGKIPTIKVVLLKDFIKTLDKILLEKKTVKKGRGRKKKTEIEAEA